MSRVCTRLLVAVFVVLLQGGVVAAEVALPPLARVTERDSSGATWQQSGELGGSVVTAVAEVRAAMAGAGWRLDKRIVLGRGVAPSELMLWVCGKRRVLFMVWEREAGTCGFAWGEER